MQSELRNAHESMAFEHGGEGGQAFPIPRRDGEIAGFAHKLLSLGQRGYAPGDPFRAVDQSHVFAEHCTQFFGEEREVRAGEHQRETVSRKTASLQLSQDL